MKPSDIMINAVPPLCATFGRTEREAAAALIVGALAAAGDTWRPITLDEIKEHGGVLSALPWMQNPFVRPDIEDLVRRGFASLSDDRTTVELLPNAIEVLRLSPWNMEGRKG